MYLFVYIFPLLKIVSDKNGSLIDILKMLNLSFIKGLLA